MEVTYLWLQEYCLVALDVFRKFPYTKDKNEQTGWLSLLVTENLTDAEKYMNDYPWLEEIYREIAMLRHKSEEKRCLNKQTKSRIRRTQRTAGRTF